MKFRLVKFCISSMHLLCLWLSFKLISGQLDQAFTSGALAVSGFWLGLTLFRLRQLFQTYFDRLSRLQVFVPMSLRILFSGLVPVANTHKISSAIALVEAASWIVIYLLYRKNRNNYITQGHGLLPKDCWVNPPAEALQPGDLLLTSGRMAERLHESVGHGELVIRAANGKLFAFSSYMEKGAVLNYLEDVTAYRLGQGHYVALRMRQTWDGEQVKAAMAQADKMLQDNHDWRQKTNAKRLWLLQKLPLPKSWKQKLTQKIQTTGYDWSGLFIGLRHNNRWTCVGACLELYHRIGVKVRNYGTGVLGLGTGLLNPIMPVRFLSDPALRVLTLEDKRYFETRSI